MVTTAVHYERSGTSEPETEPGWFLGLLLHRRGLVLLTALLFMVLAGVAGRDAGDKLVSGAYLDPSADSQQAAELLTHQSPAAPRTWSSSSRRAPAPSTLLKPRNRDAQSRNS